MAQYSPRIEPRRIDSPSLPTASGSGHPSAKVHRRPGVPTLRPRTYPRLVLIRGRGTPKFLCKTKNPRGLGALPVATAGAGFGAFLCLCPNAMLLCSPENHIKIGNVCPRR
jgi:hypothetical protein